MDIKDLKSLIKMVTETDITEFELEGAEEKIRIKRGCAPQVVQYQAPAPMMAVPQPVAAPVAAAPASAAVSAAPAPAVAGGKEVTSPIVGTFYRAPAPDAAPYVEVGQVVEKGQVLCIVEAMKLMNEIEAEFRCKIVQICKENAQPVEFGEPLFIVEPM
ncbi:MULTISPECIES: acetyl-CoA carboxylase biotin carboxyl carrier protein [Geobacter]|uniref:acetyl-CoA carboxylase biotin carboxyl carrier protein n=1 Tax=Geobacter TaxID=28231 RepID=UPI0025735C54|nr:acetyl-CoA carboxylase biotin carboxyl carrier protein [Geobacter sulfurreducens]BEH09985.1 acetyl-CoA carboxylase biotin carboxyl carrier protein [Geobacter sulfurreducens subsp. ethanolicus]BET58426.1 acetyl-CoA carboxylase biotin carboxyl carrier protein [Geobacter sp. 60473]HML77958.1 acetyl-CoA carboxylase biotin carboxyl carrier protein [Geobacter sulfurreducens]